MVCGKILWQDSTLTFQRLSKKHLSFQIDGLYLKMISTIKNINTLIILLFLEIITTCC